MQCVYRNHENFKEGSPPYTDIGRVKYDLVSGVSTRSIDVGRMRLNPSWSHGLMINNFSLEIRLSKLIYGQRLGLSTFLSKHFDKMYCLSDSESLTF